MIKIEACCEQGAEVNRVTVARIAKIVEPYRKKKLMGPVYYSSLYTAISRSARTRIFLAIEQESGKIVGFLFLRFKVRKPELWVDKIAVDQECTGKGVGSLLMQAAMQIAADQNLDCVLTVAKINQEAIKFYHKLGFELDRDTPRKDSKTTQITNLMRIKRKEQIA